MRANGVLEMDSVPAWRHTPCRPRATSAARQQFDAELCRHCQADGSGSPGYGAKSPSPMIAPSALSAGQDVFLGMLTDMLSRQDEHMQLLARRVLDPAPAAHDGSWPTANSEQDAE